MKRLAIFFGLALSITVFDLSRGILPAYACTPEFEYRPDIELFRSGDFNSNGSEFDMDYQSQIFRDVETPEVLGIYRVEIVATVNPVVLSSSDSNPVEISRGSVAVVTDYWGHPPDELSPHAAGFPTRWERKPDTGACESLTYPPNHSAGKVWYRAHTSEGPLEIEAEDTLISAETLDAGFTSHTTVESDQAAEDQLVKEMRSEHNKILAAHNQVLAPPVVASDGEGRYKTLKILLALPIAFFLAVGVFAVTRTR